MLKNYITIAINNLLKNKLYSAINIIGLAIGLAACIVIALYVRDQYSYDTQWKYSDRIYRLNYSMHPPGNEPNRLALSGLEAMPALQEYVGDKIEQGARTCGLAADIHKGNDKFRTFLLDVDPSFIEIFQFEVLSGSLEDTLASIRNIALSEETASRHFGSRDPIGKVIAISIGSGRIDYKVTAVYRIPGNTVLDDIQILSLLDETLLPPYWKDWSAPNCSTYIKLKAGVDIETLKPLLPALTDRNVPWSDQTQLTLDFQRLDTAHLDTPWDKNRAGGYKTLAMSFAGISLLVLLIGCINFTILTTAKASQRAREVAMRKVVGAKRKQLIVQFLVAGEDDPPDGFVCKCLVDQAVDPGNLVVLDAAVGLGKRSVDEALHVLVDVVVGDQPDGHRGADQAGVGEPVIAEVKVAGVLAAKDGVVFFHERLDQGVADPGTNRLATHPLDQLRYGPGAYQVVENGLPRILVEQ